MGREFKDFKEEIWKHFKDYQHIFLGTAENDQPRVRPVTLVNFDGRFYLLTGTDSAKVRQISQNPKIEFCLPFEEEGHHGYIRATGYAETIRDRETRVKVAKHCDFFYRHWENPDDADYALLELKLDEFEYLRPSESIARKFKL